MRDLAGSDLPKVPIGAPRGLALLYPSLVSPRTRSVSSIFNKAKQSRRIDGIWFTHVYTYIQLSCFSGSLEMAGRHITPSPPMSPRIAFLLLLVFRCAATSVSADRPLARFNCTVVKIKRFINLIDRSIGHLLSKRPHTNELSETRW